MDNRIETFFGLTNEEVSQQQEIHGKNIIVEDIKTGFFKKVVNILLEPMFLLLFFSSMIYFVLKEPFDGTIMLVFIIVIIGIELYQEWRADKTLKELKKLSAPESSVIRNGEQIEIESEELVPKDILLISEGDKIPADGWIIRSVDLRVNESSLTGEAEAVWKVETLEKKEREEEYWRKDYAYAGTHVVTGSGMILVHKTGKNTEYGKISEKLENYQEKPSQLDREISKIVKIAGMIAFFLFLLVFLVTFFNSNQTLPLTIRLVDSLLSGITLAMAMIPEEFPVVLTVFMSMGAWRLAKKRSLVKKMSAIESMGAISILAVDKTGTITQNKMVLTEVLVDEEYSEEEVMGVASLASEVAPYDPMEQAILEYYEEKSGRVSELFQQSLIHEYSFTDELKMMGHVWQEKEKIIICVKGSPESVLNICRLSKEKKQIIFEKIEKMAQNGLRVIAIGKQELSEENRSEFDIPENMVDLQLDYMGLVGFSDPPRKGIEKQIQKCQQAGIKVVMITGDHSLTAQAIAEKIGMKKSSNVMTGTEINHYSEDELVKKIGEVSIFSRVTPEHKMKIIQAFQSKGEVVAMTGDGVNDAPALKYADIGISMGKNGSEVSREAADLVLLDDNFEVIVETVRDGRRIYENIKKAVEYIFTVHIPIAFSALCAPILGIPTSALLLLPIHVVLLELIIDPTCSVVLERGPSEPDSMNIPPRKMKDSLITLNSILKSIVQGFILFFISFGTYAYYYYKMDEVEIARTMGITILIIANIFLVLTNSSRKELTWKNIELLKDRVIFILLSAMLIFLGILIYTPLNRYFGFTVLSFCQIGLALFLGMVSVVWYDLIKIFKVRR